MHVGMERYLIILSQGHSHEDMSSTKSIQEAYSD